MNGIFMLEYFKYLFVLVLFIDEQKICFGKKIKMEKILMCEKVDLCLNNDQLAMRYNNIQMNNQGRGIVSYSANVTVTRNIPSIKTSLVIERCTDSDATNCEHFMKVADVTVCQGMYHVVLDKSFFALFQPRMECPIKAGNYRFEQNGLDNNYSKYLLQIITPDPKYTWKFIIKYHDNDKKLVYCLKVLFRVSERRIKAQ